MIRLKDVLALFDAPADRGVELVTDYDLAALRLISGEGAPRLGGVEVDNTTAARLLEVCACAGRRHNLFAVREGDEQVSPAECWAAVLEGAGGDGCAWVLRVGASLMWRSYAFSSHESPLARDGALVLPLTEHRALVWGGALGVGWRLVESIGGYNRQGALRVDVLDDPLELLCEGLRVLNGYRKACDGITVACLPSPAQRAEGERWAIRYDLTVAYLHYLTSGWGEAARGALNLPPLYPSII